jgi:RHS repeat-associated protein
VRLARLNSVKNNRYSNKQWTRASVKQRTIALFFCLLFSVSVLIPAVDATVMAQPKNPELPGALDTVQTKHQLAVDAQIPKGKKVSNAALNGEILGGSQTEASKPGSKHEEIVAKRTHDSKTFDTGGGRLEVRKYMGRAHFKDTAGKWKQIDTTLVKDANAADSTNLVGKGVAWVKDKMQDISTYKVKANDWQARFASSSDKVGMVRIQADGKNISFSPRGATKDVTPLVTKGNDGKTELVKYVDLWPETDVVYSIKNDMLKEEIVLKSAQAKTEFEFTVSGAKLTKNKEGGFDVEGVKQSFSALSVTLQKSGPTSDKVIVQDFENDVLSIKLDKTWLKKLAANQFPVVIDPTWGRTGYISWNYTAYKSDGYICYSNNCFVNAGAVYDNGWKNWRTVFYVDYSALRDKVFLGSSMYLQQANRSYLAGYEGDRYYEMSNASCFGFNCINWSRPRTSALINYGGSIETSSIVQAAINANHWDQSFILNGEEYGAYTQKGFDPDLSYMEFWYSSTPAKPTVVTPQPDQTFTDPQVSFQVSPVGDFDGDKVQYYFRIATGSDGETGTVINSGDIDSTQWTVPDGVLQDGTTYYLHAYARDPYAYSAPSDPIKFKIDMRRGKSKTQTYDTIGPVDVDLATGNVSTSLSSHDTTALGGSLGVSLDYNSPLRSRYGLVGRYWNTSVHNIWPDQNSVPAVTRIDKEINFNWDLSSYSSGQNNDGFFARWDGYFIAPNDGIYEFGGSNDDSMFVYLKGRLLYDNSCYSSKPCYQSVAGSSASNGIYLNAGEAAPLIVQQAEYTGPTYARLYVKGPVAEQIVPNAWLQTGARPVQQHKGLQGRYYSNNSGNNLDAADKNIFLSRIEPVMNFNWGTQSPIPNGAVDFMSRWEGYISVPKTAEYEFTTLADDGTRLSIDGQDLSPAGSWNKCCSDTVFTRKTLEVGKQYYIKIDHYDGGGSASMALYVRSTDNTIGKQIVPTSWLSPTRQVLPDGWQLGIDPDGELSYERINTTTASATLTDSSGDTHMYSWTGSGYKPPINEDGQLTRNADGTFTLIDIDGKTYNFEVDGQLGKVTIPTDDRKPAALQYTYDTGKISKIADGIDSERYAAVYYYGDGKGKCTVSDGFDDESWLQSNAKFYVCALITNDGRTTRFLYKQGYLARVLKAGNEAVDYQYDQIGRIVAIRDSVANDVVVAGVRANDETVLTQLTYDALGRATAVKAPAATTGGVLQEQTIKYLPGAKQDLHRLHTSVTHISTAAKSLPGTDNEDWNMVSVWKNQMPGTHAVYRCQRSNGTNYATKDAICQGNPKMEVLGYFYGAPTGDAVVPMSRLLWASSGYTLEYPATNLSGWQTDEILGYGFPAGTNMVGQTKQHITGDAEPKGFTRKVDWDQTFRTVRDTDVTGKVTEQQWDGVKDLLLSTTDATGLKSTTIYDANDMPTDSYGPAPAAWFGVDRRPTSMYMAQVPHTATAYDEGMKGLAVAWYDYKRTDTSQPGVLFGAPQLHTTGITIANPGQVAGDLTSVPFTSMANMQGFGLRGTGKLYLDNGTYWLNAYTAEGVRVWVDDHLVVDGWQDAGLRTVTGGSFTVANPAGTITPKRLRIEAYKKFGSVGTFNITMKKDNGFDWTTDWSQWLRPDYGLQTSQTVHGAPTANGQTANLKSRTNYGNKPEYGLAQSVTTDADGPLALTATSTYETPGEGYLRQTSSSLPGGATTKYEYYSATQVVTNPCDAAKSYRQGGMLRLKTEPDPDGAAGPQMPRTVETVYDDAGKVAATRYNNEAWTCTTYDARERVLETKVPAFGNQAARTVTNNYAVGGNPLVTSSSDDSGMILVETDLLGRNVKYTDAKGNTTTSQYDNQGHLTQRVSKLGTEDFVYDDYDRLTDQKLDGVRFAHVNYDEYSRITSVDYPNSQKLAIGRESTTDGLGRVNKRTYTLASGQTLTDEVTRAVTGDIASGTELGQTKSYTYDTTGRLTAATVAGNSFTYGYGAQDASCIGKPGVATDLTLPGKDSNRTTQTINGAATTFCYDQADRLVTSSDAKYDAPVYDAHGNTTRLGTAANGTSYTNFVYDSSDRNMAISQFTDAGNGYAVYYGRDVQGRLTYREFNDVVDWNWKLKNQDWYGYTASGDSPDFITDTNGTVTEKYLTLPGDVLVTIRPNKQSAGIQTYSLPNIHGDTMATVNADGILTALHMTGPFGENLPNQPQTLGLTTSQPNNTVQGASFGYVGQHEKLTEATLALQPIQMGARVYLPGLGRFLSVDPEPGGNDNAYVYANDPVNDFDLDGTKINFKKIATFASYASMIPGPIGMVAAGVSVAAYAAAGDKKAACIAAISIAAAAVGAGAAVKAAQVSKSASNAVKITQTTRNAAKARNLTEQLVLKQVKANPRIGTQIMKGKINDKTYRPILGWQKMQYVHRPLTGKGKQVTVHYFYNKYIRSVRQLKFKR